MVMVIENGHYYTIEALLARDRRDGDGDGSKGHCYKIEAVMHVIDEMAMVLDIVIEFKL